MKTIQQLLNAALMLGYVLAAQADSIATESKFLQALEQSQFDAAHAMFSEEVAAQLSRAQLEQIWSSLPGQMGEYQGHEPAQIETSDAGRLAVFRLNFANMPLDARIHVNPAEQVEGFRLVPAATVQVAEPEVAQPSDEYSEQDLVVAGDLPGVLTLPNAAGPFPLVILVHGSGPGDRDQTLGPNKPFRDLAHGLAEQGVASLRYDKRALVQPEAFNGAYTVELEVLADVRAAVDQVQAMDSIHADQVYLAGLSLGGLLAPRIGQQRADLAGLILLAAPARNLEVMVPQQLRYLFGLDGEIDQTEATQLAVIDAQAALVADYADPESAQPGLIGMPQSYLLDLRDYDPVAVAEMLNMPILILQGGRDYQVTVEDDFIRWQQAFADSERVELKQYSNLNHIFIAGEGMATPSEYMNTASVVEPQVIDDIAAWIKAQQSN
ncbi:MAG: alpha/beta fold hydrolase [Pseudomonadota bacterium]